MIAAHHVLEGRNQRRVAAGHRKVSLISDRHFGDNQVLITRTGDVVAVRPLEFYQAVGRRLARSGDLL